MRCESLCFLVLNRRLVLTFALPLLVVACASNSRHPAVMPETFVLDYNTPVDARLQQPLEEIDARLRAKYGMTTEQTAVGLLDLNRPRLAMTHPDRIEYAMESGVRPSLLAH
jgi:hypothetical protein